MANATHTEARFNDENTAREHLESIRWPNGPVCPHCGGIERNSQLQGKSHRAGLYFCGDCRKQFTVTVGTVFEGSKIPLHKWLYANHLICTSKKGISSKQLERMLGVSYKTAWFMSHRLRKAMKTLFHVANVTAKTVAPILREQVAKKARLITNEAKVYEAR